MVSFFSNQFKEHLEDPRLLNEVRFKSLFAEVSSYLTSPFLLFESNRTMSSCDENKSFGPDSFNFSFLKRFWPLIR